MENEIKIFENEEFGSMRTLKEENGRVVFCGSDVAKALGYRNVSDALIRHCKGIVKHDTLTNGGMQTLSFIPEGDVYRLVAHSRLPSAEKFESWIFDEVLPTIRRTGGYVANEDMFIENYLPFLEEPYQGLFRLQMMAINQLTGSFFYCDPPYFATENYYKDVGFKTADHVRLRDTLMGTKGKFLVSYNDCPEIRKIWNQSNIKIEEISRLNNLAQRYEGGCN